MNVVRHRIRMLAVSAMISAFSLGCAPKEAATDAKSGTSPTTEVKGAGTTGKKLPTPAELAKEIERVGPKEWAQGRGEPEVYAANSNGYAAGWKGLAADESGKPYDLTIVGFDREFKLAIYEGKPYVIGRMLCDPLPNDKTVDREAIRKCIQGRKPAEVKRVMGTPKETSEQFGVTTWVYEKRSKDDITGKDDAVMTVSYRNGWVEDLSFR